MIILTIKKKGGTFAKVDPTAKRSQGKITNKRSHMEGKECESAHATRKFPDEEVHTNHHRAKNSSPVNLWRM